MMSLMAQILSESDVKLDAKHRVTVRKPVAEHYRMKQYEDGTIILEPMELVSRGTLAQMEKAIELVKEGVVGEPVDMSQVQSLISEDDV
jgi:hypothetical protein